MAAAPAVRGEARHRPRARRVGLRQRQAVARACTRCRRGRPDRSSRSTCLGDSCGARRERELFRARARRVHGRQSGTARGCSEEASRGTIFFDEIGDLAIGLQAKLLRALQEGEIRRLGENRPRRIDVRVVSATSRGPRCRRSRRERFREDLFYRLHVAVIALPPLGSAAAMSSASRGTSWTLRARRRPGGLRLSPEAAAALAAHAWPGNVRELQNAMAQAAALADGEGVVAVGHLPETLQHRVVPRGGVESYRSRLDAHRRGMISDALARAGGNRSPAARDLGLSRQALPAT